MREDHARRAQRAGDDARLHDAVADRAGRLIAASADDRRSRRQSRELSGVRGDRRR